MCRFFVNVSRVMWSLRDRPFYFGSLKLMGPLKFDHNKWLSYLFVFVDIIDWGLKISFLHYRLAAPSSAPGNLVRPKPGSYAKFLSIDVSSPLGQYINDLTKSACDSIDIKALCQMERKTAALRSSYGQRGARRTRFPVTFRGPKDRLAQKQSPHQYCFTREQFRQRIQTLKTGKNA